MNVFQVAFCISIRVVLFESGMEEILGGKEIVDVPSNVFLIVNFIPCLTIFSCLLVGFLVCRTVI